MKSGLVAMAVALVDLKRGGASAGEVLFAATAGEEIDCCGIRRFVELGALQDATAVAIAEPTREDVILAHKGALWIELTTRGKTAYGSIPEEGVNAIEHMYHLLGRLLEFRFAAEPDPVLGAPTLSVNRIDGGVKVNVVPDECRLQIDIRTIPSQGREEVLESLQRHLEPVRKEVSALDYGLKILQERSPVSTVSAEPFARTAEDLRAELHDSPSSRVAAPYYTDASFLIESMPLLPVVIYGPGDDRLAHQPNQWVGVEAFLRSANFYRELASRPLP